MAPVFPEAEFEIIIYILLGAFMALTAASGLYIWKLRRFLDTAKDKKEDLRCDNIGLSRRAEEIMNVIMEEPMLQSELPSELNVSKATISNATSELKDKNLIIRKKKANTYLIEPDRDELEKQQR
jgi:uncharacterized membrane protein